MKETEVRIPISMMGDPEPILKRYRELVASGTVPRMAEILASRKFPGVETDTMRMAGVPPLEETCGPAYAARMKKLAREAGIAISDNSRYNPTMADSRRGGDPNAWTHAGDGTSTFKRRLEEMGGGSEDLGVKMDMARVAENFEKKRARLDKKKREQDAVKAEKRDKLLRG